MNSTVPKPVCVYCTLKEIREREVFRTEHSWVFPTNIPIVPGHLLVAPIRCVAKLEHLSDIEVLDLMKTREKAMHLLTKMFGASQFNFDWNDGPDAGQSVPHVHLHVLPRTKDDAGVHGYEPRQFLYRPGSREKTPESELLDISKELRKIYEAK